MDQPQGGDPVDAEDGGEEEDEGGTAGEDRVDPPSGPSWAGTARRTVHRKLPRIPTVFVTHGI